MPAALHSGLMSASAAGPRIRGNLAIGVQFCGELDDSLRIAATQQPVARGSGVAAGISKIARGFDKPASDSDRVNARPGRGDLVEPRHQVMPRVVHLKEGQTPGGSVFDAEQGVLGEAMAQSTAMNPEAG